MQTRLFKVLIYNCGNSRDFLIAYLKALNYEVIEVGFAGAFAEKLIEDEFDVLIMDVLEGSMVTEQMMLLEYAKENAPNAFRVIVTENTSEVAKIQAYERGAELYYNLPMSSQELIYQLQILDNYRRTYKPTSILADIARVKEKKKEPEEKYLPFGNYTIDLRYGVVYSETNRPLVLWSKAFKVLAYLATYGRTEIPVRKVLLEIWSDTSPLAYNQLRSYLSTINKTLFTCTLKFRIKRPSIFIEARENV